MGKGPKWSEEIAQIDLFVMARMYPYFCREVTRYDEIVTIWIYFDLRRGQSFSNLGELQTCSVGSLSYLFLA
jgi:hypothetical protein